MSLFSSRSNAQTPSMLLGYRVQTSIYGKPIPIPYGQVRAPGNVIWTGDWAANPAPSTGGKGGSKGGGKGGSSGQQFNYSTAIQVALCQGPIRGIGFVWIDKIKLLLNGSKQTVTVPGGLTYQPPQHASFVADTGVGAVGSYSVTVTDYGAPGPVTLSGTQTTPWERVASSPGPNQYSIDETTGTYTFNSANIGATIQISYNWIDPNASFDGAPITSLALAFFSGTQGQAPWGFLTTNHPDQALGYTNLAYVANENLDLGPSGLVPNYGFELLGILPFGAGILDCNPADVISDFLANQLHGVLFPGSAIGDLTELSDFCVANGLFISELVDSARPASAWLKDWLTIANCEAVWSEGLLKFRSYGDKTVVGNGATFSPTTAPVYDLDSDDFLIDKGEEPIKVDRPSVRDAYNQVFVEWINRGNSYQAETVDEKNDWAINQYGLRPTSFALHGLTSQLSAQKVANFILNRYVYIRTTYRFKLSAIKYALLEPMDMVTLTKSEQGLNLTPVRIKSIQEGDDYDLDVEAEEFPWGTASPTLNPKQSVGPFGPGYYANPGPVNAPIFWEPAPEQNQGTRYQLYIALSGTSNWGGADVWVSLDGLSYSLIGRQNGPAVMGSLTAPYPDGPDPDDSDTLSVDLAESGGLLDSFTEEQEDNFIPQCAIDQELVAYRTATLTGPNTFNLTHCRRGVFGTPIQAHKTGAPFLYFSNGLFVWDYDPADVGKTLYFKFTSFNTAGLNEQDISDSAVTVYRYQIKGPRAPYPWNANGEAPFSTHDLIYGTTPKPSIQQSYETLEDGSIAPALVLTGVPPRNRFSTKTTPPVIAFTSQTTTGGFIPGGITLAIAVTAIGSDGLETELSDVVEVDIPADTNTNKLNFAITFANAGDSGCYAIALGGSASGFINKGDAISPTIAPGSTTFAITSATGDGNCAPDKRFDHFQIRVKKDWHAGIWGGSITGISGGGLVLEFAGGAWTVNSLAGRVISCLSKLDLTRVPLMDLAIISNTADTITLGTNIGGILAVGDNVAIRAIATSSTLTSVTDSEFINGGPGQPGTGFTVDENKGRLLWVIKGAGAGQIVPIKSNTTDTLELATSLVTALDSTSIFIIVDSTWINLPEGSPLDVSEIYSLELLAPVDNATDATWLVQVLTVDVDGDASDEADSPFREIFQPGKGIGAASIQPGYFDLTPDGFGNVQIDLANGLNQRLVLDGTAVTFLLPIWSAGTIEPGMYFSLYLDQDSSGAHATPAFNGGAGGFASDVGNEQVAPDASTRTSYIMTYHGTVWAIDSFRTGGAIT